MIRSINLTVFLFSKRLHEKAKEVGFKTQDYMMAREWITRDYMIIMSGVTNECDVIFTADRKTFYPICKDIEQAYCVLTYPELFDTSEQFILGYRDAKVEEFLQGKRSPKPVERKTPNLQVEDVKKIEESGKS